MTGDIRKRLEPAAWVARTLFQRGRVTGNTGNISLRIGERIYVSASGSTFASLTEAQFGVTDLDGRILEGPKMSKEWPLHLAVYRARRKVGAVIHTHSPVSYTHLDVYKRQDLRQAGGRAAGRKQYVLFQRGAENAGCPGGLHARTPAGSASGGD